jgi:hypothetical protein
MNERYDIVTAFKTLLTKKMLRYCPWSDGRSMTVSLVNRGGPLQMQVGYRDDDHAS